MHRPRLLSAFVASAMAAGMTAPVNAQVAFVPGISSFPNGVSLSAVPVVSADRRYVRMTLNPQFTAIEGFDTFSIPAAVSGLGAGGGLGGGGLGGLGGLGGGGGAAGGGFRSIATPGPTFVAGMDGVVSQDQGGYSSGGYFPQRPSPDASAFLSGAAGFPERPHFSGVDGAGTNGLPRAKTSRQPSQSPKSKRARTSKARPPRGG